MRLNTRSRYAIRALLDLSSHCTGNPVSIKEIASRQDISERYLENIFRDLAEAGILTSSKGKKGGFIMKIPLNEISVLRIIDIMEGQFNLVDCVADPHSCGRSAACDSRRMWTGLNARMRQMLSQVMLSDGYLMADS
jgi:Rrf2 family protein